MGELKPIITASDLSQVTSEALVELLGLGCAYLAIRVRGPLGDFPVCKMGSLP